MIRPDDLRELAKRKFDLKLDAAAARELCELAGLDNEGSLRLVEKTLKHAKRLATAGKLRHDRRPADPIGDGQELEQADTRACPPDRRQHADAGRAGTTHTTGGDPCNGVTGQRFARIAVTLSADGQAFIGRSETGQACWRVDPTAIASRLKPGGTGPKPKRSKPARVRTKFASSKRRQPFRFKSRFISPKRF